MKYQFNCVFDPFLFTHMLHRTFKKYFIKQFNYVYIRCKAVVLLIEYKQRNECVASLDSLLLGLRDHRDFSCNIIYLTFKNH